MWVDTSVFCGWQHLRSPLSSTCSRVHFLLLQLFDLHHFLAHRTLNLIVPGRKCHRLSWIVFSKIEKIAPNFCQGKWEKKYIGSVQLILERSMMSRWQFNYQHLVHVIVSLISFPEESPSMWPGPEIFFLNFGIFSSNFFFSPLSLVDLLAMLGNNGFLVGLEPSLLPPPLLCSLPCNTATMK